MRRTEPLFRLDPGWLFTLAGLAIIVASALLPADRDLHEMRQQLATIEARQAWNDRRLQAYDGFLKELAAKDPALMRRLAASQLNLMPEGERPLLMATSIEHTVSDWIEAAVEPSDYEPVPPPDTLLSRLAGGPRRLWLMGGGAMMVFMGLMTGIGVSARPALPAQGPSSAQVEEAVTPAATEAWAATPRETVQEADPHSVWGAALAANPGAVSEDTSELSDESAELEPSRSTASAVEVDAFEWAEPAPPFEAPESDTGATPQIGARPAESASDAPLDAEAWMRDHGSD